MTKYCLECAKNEQDCCGGDYAGFTTLKDAERISNFCGKKISEFVIYDKLSENDKKTELFAKKPHNYYYDLASSDGKILQLKRKKDGSCIFQKKPGLCEIYQVRPLICQVFPFWYSREGDIIIDNNGLECSIICNSKKNKYETRLATDEMHNQLAQIGYSKPAMKKLLSQLKKEIEEYKAGLFAFLRKNGFK